MSKKGAVQQLQLEVNTDEDLIKFVTTKDGVLLLEVYTGWCGPCVAMLGTLKKIKLEKGGDDLTLSIVKADEIPLFARFRNKSEPTWLFAVGGRLRSGMFGTNVPELIKVISDEIDMYRAGATASRKGYELDEMCEFELVRYNVKKEIEERNTAIETAERVRKRTDYLTSVTDEINERLFDMGVTIFMPHTINKDLAKRVSENADKFALSTKDKRMVRIQEKDLEWINFKIDNPLPEFYMKLLFEKDVYMVAFKLADSELRPTEEVLTEFVNFLNRPVALSETVVANETLYTPPLLKYMPMMINDTDYASFLAEQTENDATTRAQIAIFHQTRQSTLSEAEGVIPAEAAAEAEPPAAPADTAAAVEGEATEGGEAGEAGEATGAGSAEGEEAPKDDEGEEKKGESDEEGDDEEQEEEPEPEAEAEAEPEIEEDTVSSAEELTNQVFILPVWTAANKTANAALIYLYFRLLTDHFLGPDPEPDPPHVAIVFDAIKRADIMAHVDLHRPNVISYGYFTSDKPTEAVLLADSTYKYEKLKFKATTDCLVIKLAKKTSNTLLTFISKNPTYVSQNTREGEKECQHFFPDGYENSSEEPEEDEEGEEEEEETGGGAVEAIEAGDNADEAAENDAVAEGQGEGAA